MKIPTTIKWGFNPDASDIAALKTRTGRLLWAIIRSAHIVDQHFNGQVERFAKGYDAGAVPAEAELDVFLWWAWQCDLDVYGTSKYAGNFDREWWGELLEVLRGQRQVEEIAWDGDLKTPKPQPGGPEDGQLEYDSWDMGLQSRLDIAAFKDHWNKIVRGEGPDMPIVAMEPLVQTRHLAAERSLRAAGYTYTEGAEAWKPALGPSPFTTWRCFHCDELFTTREAAAEHFGTSEMQQPACTINAAEYRRMEAVCRSYAEEDTELHRALHAKQSEMNVAVRRAEEAGYARGLKDANHVEPITLNISSDDSMITVDDPHLPGSPAVGRDRTIYAAIGRWFHHHQERLRITFNVQESAKPAEAARRAREEGKR